jgi:hypothetical protein
MANRLDNTTPPNITIKGAFERLKSTVRACCMEGPSQSIIIELETLLSLSRALLKIWSHLLQTKSSGQVRAGGGMRTQGENKAGLPADFAWRNH